MVIFFLVQRFFILNSYYKSRMVVFRSRLVIMISHDSFSFSYSNFNFSYGDFPISDSDFSISHIYYWNSIGDFELIPLLSCLACHREDLGRGRVKMAEQLSRRRLYRSYWFSKEYCWKNRFSLSCIWSCRIRNRSSQRRVFYLSLVSSPCRRVKMTQQWEHEPRHLLAFEEVRVLTEQMSQPNRSNVSAKVSRVFGRSKGRLANPSCNQNVSSTSSTHFRRTANMRRLGTRVWNLI